MVEVRKSASEKVMKSLIMSPGERGRGWKGAWLERGSGPWGSQSATHARQPSLVSRLVFPWARSSGR